MIEKNDSPDRPEEFGVRAAVSDCAGSPLHCSEWTRTVPLRVERGVLGLIIIIIIMCRCCCSSSTALPPSHAHDFFFSPPLRGGALYNRARSAAREPAVAHDELWLPGRCARVSRSSRGVILALLCPPEWVGVLVVLDKAASPRRSLASHRRAKFAPSAAARRHRFKLQRLLFS